jgi:hypothetical protein
MRDPCGKSRASGDHKDRKVAALIADLFHQWFADGKIPARIET